MQAQQEQVQSLEAVQQMLEEAGRVTADKIIDAVAQIVEVARPLQVIAFGSRARRDHRADSDLDLAVIVKTYDKRIDPRPIWRSDVRGWISMDILVMSKERLEFMKDSIVSVQHDIWNEGVTLYDVSTGRIDQSAAARLAG